MDAARHKRRNLIQNIVIACLTVSAVFLFAQLQLYNLDTTEDPHYLERLTGTLPDESPSQLREFPAPVRVVITDSYGRYGSLDLTTNSSSFSALGLREALGSLQSLAPSSVDEFRAALSVTSVYFDFLEPLPLSVLAGLIGVDETPLTGDARCLLLAAQEDETVWLYLWDGAESFFKSAVPATSLSADTLTEAAGQSGFGGVSFAFDDVEVDPLYGELFPLSILPTELPELPVLSAASPLSDTDWLLPFFGFNSNTKERYTEADGTEVITEVETDRSLHIQPDGSIVYRSGTEATPEISAQEQNPTAAESALGCSILLQELTEGLTGEASLYLQSVSQSGDYFALLLFLKIRMHGQRKHSSRGLFRNGEVSVSVSQSSEGRLFVQAFGIMYGSRYASALHGFNDSSPIAVLWKLYGILSPNTEVSVSGRNGRGQQPALLKPCFAQK